MEFQVIGMALATVPWGALNPSRLLRDPGLSRYSLLKHSKLVSFSSSCGLAAESWQQLEGQSLPSGSSSSTQACSRGTAISATRLFPTSMGKRKARKSGDHLPAPWGTNPPPLTALLTLPQCRVSAMPRTDDPFHSYRLLPSLGLCAKTGLLLSLNYSNGSNWYLLRVYLLCASKLRTLLAFSKSTIFPFHGRNQAQRNQAVSEGLIGHEQRVRNFSSNLHPRIMPPQLFRNQPGCSDSALRCFPSFIRFLPFLCF